MHVGSSCRDHCGSLDDLRDRDLRLSLCTRARRSRDELYAGCLRGMDRLLPIVLLYARIWRRVLVQRTADYRRRRPGRTHIHLMFGRGRDPRRLEQLGSPKRERSRRACAITSACLNLDMDVDMRVRAFVVPYVPNYKN